MDVTEVDGSAKNFACTKCGACCRNVTHIPGLGGMALEDGRCRNLLEDNGCAIYDERPLLCRVNESHRLVAHIMPLEDWQELNYRACGVLQEKYGISIS